MNRQHLHRFLILWTVGSALWLSALLIHVGTTRPAPGFNVIAPLVVGVPALVLALGLAVLRWRGRRSTGASEPKPPQRG